MIPTRKRLLCLDLGANRKADAHLHLGSTTKAIEIRALSLHLLPVASPLILISL